jgi:phosphoserine phosphatase RsbU/P
MKVLIAEDDPVNSLLLQATLRRLGHEPISTGNGFEALEVLGKQEDIQVVVSDWMMPRVDGLELCRRIRSRRRFRYTYVLLVTARAGKQSYLTALEAGADDFIAKPVDPDELGARLRVAERVLGVQAEMRELQGLLSICSYCKKIREGTDTWVSVEKYVSKRADTSFSHGICPNCFEQHFPSGSG